MEYLHDEFVDEVLHMFVDRELNMIVKSHFQSNVLSETPKIKNIVRVLKLDKE